MQPTPVFLPGESHGQRSLLGYSPWGRQESDTTELTLHMCTLACYNLGVETWVSLFTGCEAGILREQFGRF